jgi:hypothetical protein
MARLLNIQIDILTLARAAPDGAPAPAPEIFQAAVDQLLSLGLLREEGGAVLITADGEAALAAGGQTSPDVNSHIAEDPLGEGG